MTASSFSPSRLAAPDRGLGFRVLRFSNLWIFCICAGRSVDYGHPLTFIALCVVAIGTKGMEFWSSTSDFAGEAISHKS